MQLSVLDLSKVLNDYLVQVIVPKIPSNILKFGLSFASGYIGENTINQFMMSYGQLAGALGIIKDGMIDINLFRENALKALKNCPDQNFEYMGYKFDSEDIDSLYKIMATYAHS